MSALTGSTRGASPGARKQAALLKYLNDHYSVIGVVGMRSGVMDQLAFSGIKILPIDISPHRYDESTALPDLSTSALLEQRTGDLFYSHEEGFTG
ncbi:MAG TPA: hypothetical protein VLE27_09390 [Thermoanaerobaculia bacterium]|nr:hypothetical protein [Thermoanaerobaculia bacterium]